jgi:MFS family permease
VTKSTASWMQLVNLVYTLPGVVVLGVAGPFSDAFGRKPVLIIASTIQLLSTGVLLVSRRVLPLNPTRGDQASATSEAHGICR